MEEQDGELAVTMEEIAMLTAYDLEPDDEFIIAAYRNEIEQEHRVAE